MHLRANPGQTVALCRKWLLDHRFHNTLRFHRNWCWIAFCFRFVGDVVGLTITELRLIRVIRPTLMARRKPSIKVNVDFNPVRILLTIFKSPLYIVFPYSALYFCAKMFSMLPCCNKYSPFYSVDLV